MPNRYNFTAAQERDITSRYRGGETCKSIATDLGYDFAVIKRVLVNAGVYEYGRKFAGRYDEAQKLAMVTRYEAGESMDAIAADLGCHRVNVRHILVRRGVKPRDNSVPWMTDDQGEILRSRRAEGAPFSIIARELGVPAHRALRWARSMGISDFKAKAGADSPSWRGGVTHHHGYTYERIASGDPHYGMAGQNGYVAQHRLVMARSLGRDLTSRESVHHINGDRTDNRLENLQLRQGQHGKGARFVCLDCGSHNVEAVGLS